MAQNLIEWGFDNNPPASVTSRSRMNLQSRRRVDNSTTAETEEDSEQFVTEEEKQAWQAYLQAKAIYESTRNPANWEYMQSCLSRWENARR